MFAWKRFALLFLLVALAGGGVWVLRNEDPELKRFLPKCVLHRATGLHCPGCGGTRAAHALVHGDWRSAVWWNPLLIVGAPLMLGAVYWDKRARRAGRPGIRRLSLTILILVLGFCAVRNLPHPSRGWLAPRAEAPTFDGAQPEGGAWEPPPEAHP
ncbi:MAG: DUF2752 domain-containing protein [Pirellulales bacterium]